MKRAGSRAAAPLQARSLFRRRRTLEVLEPRLVLTDTYVNPAWASLAAGTDPDGLGPITAVGVDAFASIQPAIDAASVGSTVFVEPGAYDESLRLTKSVTITSNHAVQPVVLSGSSSVDGIEVTSDAGDVSILRFIAGAGTQGLRSRTTGNLVAEGSQWATLDIRDANSITLQGAAMTILSDVQLAAQNQITLNTSLNAGPHRFVITANADGIGDEGFAQAAGTSLRTTDDSPTAIQITVNTLLGGTGAARIAELRAGQNSDITGGRITLDANLGAIADANEDAANVIASNAVLMGLGGVGARDALEATVHRLEGTGGNGGFGLLNSAALLIGGLQVGPAGVTAPGGAIELQSPVSMTVTEDVVGKSVFLKVRDAMSSGQDITINSGVSIVSSYGNVIVEAGDNLTLEAGSHIDSPVVGVFLKADADNLDPGFGATLQIRGVISSKIGARAEADNDEDRLQIFAMGSGGIQLDGRGRADAYEVYYPSGIATFGSTIRVDDTYGGTDLVTVFGTDADDVLFVTTEDPPTTVETEHISRGSLDQEVIVIANSMEAIYLDAGAGNDVVTAQPSAFVPIHLNGGDPCRDDAGVPPGDTLVFDPINSDFSIVGNTFRVHARDGERHPLSFIDFETVPLTPIGTGAPQLFDFNHTNTGSSVLTSPTEPGYTSVRANTLYSEGLGYGWQTSVQSFERNDGFFTGPSQFLIQDGHSFGRMATFSVDVPTPGYYLVGAMLGSPYTDVSGVKIRNEDSSAILVEGISSEAGHSTNITFVAYAPDQSLDLTFINAFVNPTIFGINALEVRPAEILTMSLADACGIELVADGVTVDTFDLVGAPANSRVTVSTTLGTIVTTDVDPELMGVQVRTDSRGQAALQIRRPTGRGIATFLMEQVGGAATGLTPISYVVPAIRNFDFNHFNTYSSTITSPTMAPVAAPQNPTGFISVLPNNLYAAERGYGWDVAPDGFDDGILTGNPRSDLHRDGHRFDKPRTFKIDLPNDTYDVRLTMGYGRATQDMRVKANGTTVIDNRSTAPGEFLEESFQITLTDGQLRLDFGKSLLNTNWVVNGIEIRSATLVTPITFAPPMGDVVADNITVTEVVAHTQMIAGAIVTASASLGAILNPDVDASVAGIQVPVDADGSVRLRVKSTLKSGVPTFSLVSTDGLHQGSISSPEFLRFTVSPSRRFDFNHIAGRNNPVLSPTAAGFVGATRLDIDALHAGFGWVESPNSSDNELPADTAWDANDRAFYRDFVSGHAQLGGRTFQVDAKPGTTYDVRVYTGNLHQDQSLRASVEGLPSSQFIETLAGQYAVLTFYGASDRNGDGLLDITVGNHGGLSQLWMANGLEVAESSIGLPLGVPLRANRGSVMPLTPVVPLTPEVLASVTSTVVSAWQSIGLTPTEQARLSAVQLEIADLGNVLSVVGSSRILIDSDGAGLGWSTAPDAVDPSRYDLLSVVAQQLGHILGRADALSQSPRLGVLDSVLVPGERHLAALLASLDV